MRAMQSESALFGSRKILQDTTCAGAKGGRSAIPLVFDDNAKFGEDIGIVVRKVLQNGQGKCLDGDRRGWGLEVIKAKVHDLSAIFFGDVDVLKKTDGVTGNGDVYVLSGQVGEQGLEIGLDQFRVSANAITKGPGSPLRDPVFAAEKKIDQHGKAVGITADIANDTVGLPFGVFCGQ